MNEFSSRWKDAYAVAARKTLAARRSALIEDLTRARHEHARLLSASRTEIGALRKCANRIYDLEQVCMVLSLELRADVARLVKSSPSRGAQVSRLTPDNQLTA